MYYLFYTNHFLISTKQSVVRNHCQSMVLQVNVPCTWLSAYRLTNDSSIVARRIYEGRADGTRLRWDIERVSCSVVHVVEAVVTDEALVIGSSIPLEVHADGEWSVPLHVVAEERDLQTSRAVEVAAIIVLAKRRVVHYAHAAVPNPQSQETLHTIVTLVERNTRHQPLRWSWNK